ncbi:MULTISPECIES: hypothetical protein [Pseudanabaena]|uniref:hypothetical protein n=1 Tax=Pseudanabaena TaxID=1152 RepID=UPI0024784EC5|nr:MULTISPECIES: hypothetical protein [Pseudanabaena]MEA5485927.1 hypothetical protein [Pseudanabaena sp. CCNP1317]WGS71345.1 hypothetical protein OA858_16740 [Pseudanabaena galeata CCNP1313]
MYFNKLLLKESLLLLTSIGLLSLTLNIPKALAGGGDEVVFADTNGNPVDVTTQNRSIGSIPTFLDWSKWQVPTHNDQTVCRAKDGNIVCVSPAQAQNLRWMGNTIPKI